MRGRIARPAQDAHHHAAIVAAPDGAVGREREGAIALVTIERRRAERRCRARVVEKARHPVPSDGGERLLGVGESVGAVFVLQRLMEMPAARHDVGDLGPAHEGRVIAVALGDLLGGAPEQDHRIGRLEARAGMEGKLDLAGAELDFERTHRQAEAGDVRAQDFEDRIHRVVTLLGQVLIALVEQGDLGRLAGWPASLALSFAFSSLKRWNSTSRPAKNA